ncbi:MAG: Fe-S cluster assembly protein SufD [Anaerolineales bacterium]
MDKKPRVVITSRSRKTPEEMQTFNLGVEMIDPASPLNGYRKAAWKEFERIPIPTTREESWRRTDLRNMPISSFNLPSDAQQKSEYEIPNELLKPIAGDEHGGQISLQTGLNQVQLDPELASKGVIFTDLTSAEKKYPDLLQKIAGDVINSQEGKFAALAAAFAWTGALLYVPKGVVIDQPLHSILWGNGKDQAIISHLMVWVDEGASVTYVHESASAQGVSNFHAGLVEIKVAHGANLRFVELQSWGDQVWNFSHERAQVGRDANLDWIFGAVGSKVTKNFSSLDLVEPGATGRMSGFYFTNGSQHLDHDTHQAHQAPNTTSDLLFKGALKGSSHSVWRGMIYVAPGAQKTDGYQANRNLVLSPTARADSIPGLEILADDVRCTHGATVGKIDEEPMFYLLSRGIPEKEAERLIVEGFFDPIMQRIPFEGVKGRFQKAIKEKTMND